MDKNLQEYFDEPDNKQTALADRMDVHQSTISRWVNGRVPAEKVLKVSTLTGISPEQLRPDIYRESPC